METSAQNSSLRSSDYIQETEGFLLPNPGDVFMVVAFAWSTLCMLLVIDGGGLTRTIARLSGSQQIRQLLLTEQTAIAALLFVGVITLGVAFFVFFRYRLLTTALAFFSFCFASSLWAPLHDLAFAIKYLLVIFFGTYGLLFFLRNGWRIFSTKGYRLAFMYVAWIAITALWAGLELGDIWYAGTEFTLLFGFGFAWFLYLDKAEELRSLNITLAYTAIVVTICHMLSPFVGVEYFQGGRFVSQFGRATGFATIFSVFVVTMFWMTMYDQNPVRKNIFTAFALIGYGLILWSGTRNATVATLIGIAALWWVFRSRIFIIASIAGMAALLAQILLGGLDATSFLVDRVASTENTRLDVWDLYLGLYAQKPIFGYSPSGLQGAVYGDSLINLISGLGGRLNIPGVHNLYLGYAVRFGSIGLILVCTIFVVCAIRAIKVVFSDKVTLEDKKLFILPATLVFLIVLQGLFEDTIGSTGKGSVHGLVLGMAIPLVYLYGGKLLRRAEKSDTDMSTVQELHGY